MRLKTMILSMKVLLLGAAVTTAAATATAQGTTRTTGTERTVHAGDYVTTITVDGTPTTITDDVKSVTAAPGAKVKVTAAPPQQGKRARLVITKAASSTSGQTQSEAITGISIHVEDYLCIYFAGDTYHLTAEVSPSSVTNKNVTWSVADGDNAEYTTDQECTYADIDNNGLLTCKARGNITIFATSTDGSYFKSSKSICIYSCAIMGVSVTAEGNATFVEGGKTLQMGADVIGPQSLDQTVTWSVYDIVDGVVRTDYPSTFASISSSGVLSPMNDGMVQVVATSNGDDTKSGTCLVLVKNTTGQASTEINPDISSDDGDGIIYDPNLKITTSSGSTILYCGKIITLSASYNNKPTDVIWSVKCKPDSRGKASIINHNELIGRIPGLVTVTAKTFSGKLIYNTIDIAIYK